MSTETEEIRELLSSTGSELYKQIGLYLYDLEFETNILVDEGDYADLFAEEDDCSRIGIPNDNKPLKQFILNRSEEIIRNYTSQKSQILLLKSKQLLNSLNTQNSDVYKQIGLILYKYCVNANDITHVDNIKLFLNKNILNKIGLKNAAKQKLAFRKVLRIINDVKKLPIPNDINNNNNDDKKEHIKPQIKPKPKPKPQPQPQPIKKTPNDIMKEMLQNGNVSSDAFWTHYFKDQKNVNYESLSNGIKSIMRLYIEINDNGDNKKRIDNIYIECVILNIISIEKKNDNSISYLTFKQYSENNNNIINIFISTQNEFELLFECNKTLNFKNIRMDNFENILLLIDIYKKLFNSNFESLVWKYIINEKFISYLPQLLNIAFKFEKNYNNKCGNKILELEMFNNSNRMSSIIGNNKSSFYSLTQTQLIYIIKLDYLAINEEKLFIAIQKWCEKDIKSSKKGKKSSSSKSLEDRMNVFLPYIRFPLMSINFLLSTILPLKKKIFSHSDDFLYIIIYKINLTMNTSRKKFKFNPSKLCCLYKNRIYESDDKKEDDVDLDSKLMKLSSENKILIQKNEELKEKNQKLKAKYQKEKEKRKSTKASVTLDSLSPTPKKKNKTRSITNAFTTIDHFAAVHAKKKSMSQQSRTHDDSFDLSMLDKQKHLKQVSKSVINQVSDLQTGASTVSFLVHVAESDNKESQDIFAQMRKRMTDRAKNVKSAHQRKAEKEREEKLEKERRKKELEETKRRLREEAKKMKKKKPKKKNKKQAQHRMNNATMVINPDITHEEIVEQDDDDDDDINEPIPNEYDDEITETNQENNENQIDGDQNENQQEQEQEQEQEENKDEIQEIQPQEETKEVEETTEPEQQNIEPNTINEPEIEQKELNDTNTIPINITENTYGYAQVHDAYKQFYFKKNNTSCTNPTHLILFAKKNGIPGVSFANANKYFKARRNDPDAMSMEEYVDAINGDTNKNDMNHLMSNPANSTSPQPPKKEDADSDGSGYSGHDDIDDEAPITIEQSMTDNAPPTQPSAPAPIDNTEKKQEMDTLPPVQEPKKRRRSKPGLDGSGKSKKKRKKLLIAAEMLGKLKKTTPYIKFETPLYILSLNVAEAKKLKDEKRLIRDLGLQLGYKVLLKQKNMKATIKFIGQVHFTYGFVVGLEMSGNGNGKHGGDMDKIKYFDSKRNGGLFVRADSIEKVLEKKKLKSSKKTIEMDKITAERFKEMLISLENDDDDEEIDLSLLSKKEKNRLERLHLEIGDLVEVDKGRKGILHFCGEVHWTDSLIFGVEFVDKAVGKYNGTYNDVEYFKCPEKRGMFFTSDKIRKKGIFKALSQW